MAGALTSIVKTVQIGADRTLTLRPGPSHSAIQNWGLISFEVNASCALSASLITVALAILAH